MTSSWRELTLGEVCSKITDGAHNSPKSVPTGKPMASVKDLTFFGINLKTARHIEREEFDKLVKQGCMPEVGDVLIAKDGNSALDTVCNIKENVDVVLLSSVAILRPDKQVLDSDFLKYYFRSKKTIEYLKSNFISGAAIPRVVLKDFKKAKIFLPSLIEQKKISKILNSIECKIFVNNTINTKLERLAQVLFKSWFVDFDPVHAKKLALEAGLAADQVERAAIAIISGVCSPIDFAENSKEMDDLLSQKLAKMSKDEQDKLRSLAALFPSELEESGLGEIPKGWKVDKIENIVTRLKAKSKYTKNNIKKQGKTIVYEQGESLVLGYTDDPPDFICGRQSPKFIFGDHTCVMKLSCIDFSISANVIPLEGKDLPTAWVYYACLGKQRFEEYRRHWAELIVKYVVVPDEKLAVAFSDFQLSLQELMENNYLLSNQLGELRDTLLPKLLAGELDLSNISVEGDELC
ncbi:MAG: restriction endonuclease subunit S [Bacteriovoracaceae bacterium]|nr:restriction endonuclease subunit S [Bacteriovoracaceae bacterium]